MVPDGVEHGGQRVGHLIIRKPEHRPAKALDLLLTMVIVELLPVLVVNLAVELDDDLQGQAGEVGEIAVDGMLAAEAKAVEAAGAEVLPERGLCAGLALAEIAGAFGSSFTRHAA